MSAIEYPEKFYEAVKYVESKSLKGKYSLNISVYYNMYVMRLIILYASQPFKDILVLNIYIYIYIYIYI